MTTEGEDTTRKDSKPGEKHVEANLNVHAQPPRFMSITMAAPTVPVAKIASAQQDKDKDQNSSPLNKKKTAASDEHNDVSSENIEPDAEGRIVAEAETHVTQKPGDKAPGSKKKKNEDEDDGKENEDDDGFDAEKKGTEDRVISEAADVTKYGSGVGDHSVEATVDAHAKPAL